MTDPRILKLMLAALHDTKLDPQTATDEQMGEAIIVALLPFAQVIQSAADYVDGTQHGFKTTEYYNQVYAALKADLYTCGALPV